MAQFLASIAFVTGNRQSVFELNYRASTNGIKVLVNHKSVAMNNTNGWVYNPSFGTIQFRGTAIPKAGDIINVIYTESCGFP